MHPNTNVEPSIAPPSSASNASRFEHQKQAEHTEHTEHSKVKDTDPKKDGRLLPGEIGYCAWCRNEFTPLRVYSKPQYFCKPFCNHTWHNHQRYLMMAEFFKQAGKPLLKGQIKALQIEAERALHGASGLKANELVRIKPSSGPIAGCKDHK